MLRGLLIAAFLAVAGFVVWYFASGNERLQLGFSADKPLGDAAQVETYLIGKGLKKFPMNKEELRIFFGERFPDLNAVTADEYVDGVAGMKHRVMLVRGTDGKLLAVGGAFRSGSKDFSLTGTRCEHFCAVYWLHVAGKKPTYEKLMEGGADARDYLLATGDRGGVHATWRKEGSGGPTMQITQEIHDTVAFVVP